MEKVNIKMIEEFQCPGCVCGSDTKCSTYNPEESCGSFYCTGHVLGTMIGLGNSVAIGLPKGFNKPGINYKNSKVETRNQMAIRLWTSGAKPCWNHLNVPVWGMEKDGYLFVRTYAPRTGNHWVDVIKDGTFDETLPSDVINVADFIDEID